MMELQEFLRNIPALQGMDDQDLKALDRAMEVNEYAEGHVFIEEGERPNMVYLIIQGEVHVTSREHGDTGFMVDRTMGKGELFGLIGLVDHKRRTATCAAAGPVTAASLPWTAFMMLYNANARLAYRFQHFVASQLAQDARNLNDLLRQAIHDITQGNVTDSAKAEE